MISRLHHRLVAPLVSLLQRSSSPLFITPTTVAYPVIRQLYPVIHQLYPVIHQFYISYTSVIPGYTSVIHRLYISYSSSKYCHLTSNIISSATTFLILHRLVCCTRTRFARILRIISPKYDTPPAAQVGGSTGW